MLGDSELISLRSREVTNRPLLTDSDGVTNRVKLTWKIINMILIEEKKRKEKTEN